MTDTSHTFGGRSPTNTVTATPYNPIAGEDFPRGTPVAQSLDADHTVVRAQARLSEMPYVTGLSAGVGVSGERTLVQSTGVLSLPTSVWDQVTGGSGGLEQGSTYYVDPDDAGILTSTQPAGFDDVQVAPVGIALSPQDMMIQITFPRDAS